MFMISQFFFNNILIIIIINIKNISYTFIIYYIPFIFLLEK